MTDFVIAVILIFIVGGAVTYIYKAKKSGVKCIGCPSGKECGKSKSNCGCGCEHCDSN